MQSKLQRQCKLPFLEWLQCLRRLRHLFLWARLLLTKFGCDLNLKEINLEASSPTHRGEARALAEAVQLPWVADA